jgi:L-seryl-tRNA(Ser) seleniumtransferase
LPLRIAIGRGRAKAGGGTLPRPNFSSVTIDIIPENCSLIDFAAALRATAPPVIGYISEERLRLDLRTVFPHQDELMVEAIRRVCTK